MAGKPKEQAPRKRGRPQYVPDEKTRTMVRMMAALGIPVDDMALILQISAPILRQHYTEQLRIGHLEANTKVAANLYTKAIGEGREAVDAAKFWLRCRAGWKEDSYRVPGSPATPDKPEPPAPKLGKKEERALAAANPDPSTSLGALMRRRAGMH